MAKKRATKKTTKTAPKKKSGPSARTKKTSAKKKTTTKKGPSSKTVKRTTTRPKPNPAPDQPIIQKGDNRERDEYGRLLPGHSVGKDTRWKPGDNPNPKGAGAHGYRSVRQLTASIAKAAEEVYEIKLPDGTVQRLPGAEAVGKRVVLEGMKGNMRAVTIMQKTIDREPPPEDGRIDREHVYQVLDVEASTPIEVAFVERVKARLGFDRGMDLDRLHTAGKRHLASMLRQWMHSGGKGTRPTY